MRLGLLGLSIVALMAGASAPAMAGHHKKSRHHKSASSKSVSNSNSQNANAAPATSNAGNGGAGGAGNNVCVTGGQQSINTNSVDVSRFRSIARAGVGNSDPTTANIGTICFRSGNGGDGGAGGSTGGAISGPAGANVQAG
jgi:hypothetical protein